MGRAGLEAQPVIVKIFDEFLTPLDGSAEKGSLIGFNVLVRVNLQGFNARIDGERDFNHIIHVHIDWRLTNRAKKSSGTW